MNGNGTKPTTADHTRQPEVEKSAAAALINLNPNIVKSEANLLRLPLFALHTKRLKTLDGIECRGRITRDGQTQAFTFRATRNTATLYPGPLARSAHLAFLSIVTEHGLPFRNPVTWTWRDLCRRMGIVCGGQMVHHLKDAITSTAALFIFSEYALYSKPEGKPIQTQQDALHLYDRVVFIGSQLPDGTTADTNFLWLSDWYLQNLNALFCAPIDYALWRRLDQESSIASRLYEFLLLNFYSSAPRLRINYETLTQFLPIKPERYLSDARRQLSPAFELLTAAGVVAHIAWADGKNTLTQLHFTPGPRLGLPAGGRTALPFGDEDFAEAIKVRELRNLKSPEWALVTDFYRLWAGVENYRPTKGELQQAADYIREHGGGRMKTLLPILVKRLRDTWPEAKTFGAVAHYLPDAVSVLDKQERLAESRRQDELREQQERATVARDAQELASLQLVWDALPQPERQEIRAKVLAQQPRNLEKFPGIIDGFCLRELARRRGAPIA